MVVDNAQKLVELLNLIFNATELRRFGNENGKIMHIELRLDDTVLMMSDSVANYQPNKSMMHIYVPDVFKTFHIEIENGCEIIEKPVNKLGDSDTRGGFMDFAGNHWYVCTQTN